MRITVQITLESGVGESEMVEVARLERGPSRPDTLGLSLTEARSILAGLEQALVEQQTAELLAQAQRCARCGRARACKGHHLIVFRTPFGKLTLDSPRLYRCPCESEAQKSFSPLAELLCERTSPELLYLETKFAALVSYGLTVELLKEVLPIGQALNTMSLRRKVQQTAGRLEAELGAGQDVFVGDGPKDQAALSSLATPIVAGLDGVYVHAKGQRSRREGWFEVIVGKSLPAEDRPSACFGFVSRYDLQPKGRLSAWLDGQRLQQEQPVTFLSDGGDTVRELPRGLIPQAEYLLDWFHVTMRLTGMSRQAKGVREADQPDLSADLEEMLEHLKWNLWHGKEPRALEILDELAYALEVEDGSPEHRKLLKAVRAFEGYIAANRALIPNYGDRYRQGKIIATAFVESAVNQVVSKRFVKKQQMRWTPAGAHLLLQVRTQVLNGDWRATLSRWYPGMQLTP
ncbi:MAG TPA: ISKra4 family transposase, partial [Gemmatimonadales bacterium]|nr:ISKra4 family transposase [Gemmatimonadales bacterium]